MGFVYMTSNTMLAFDDLPTLSASSHDEFVRFDSFWQVLYFWMGFATIYHALCVYCHSVTWKQFLYNFPCKARYLMEAIQDHIEDCHEKKQHHNNNNNNNNNNNDRSFFACPKRRQRFRKCARRCEQRRRQNDDNNNTEGKDEQAYERCLDMPCPIERCVSIFCKMHMPPPLPFVRRRHKKKTSPTDEQGGSTEDSSNLMPTGMTKMMWITEDPCHRPMLLPRWHQVRVQLPYLRPRKNLSTTK